MRTVGHGWHGGTDRAPGTLLPHFAVRSALLRCRLVATVRVYAKHDATASCGGGAATKPGRGASRLCYGYASACNMLRG